MADTIATLTEKINENPGDTDIYGGKTSMIDISVVMIAYNHENYIRQAIESVLTQKTDYSFEIVIGEDCSPDNTRAILNEYAEKYPQKIKLLKRETNLGPIKNVVDVLRNCSGRYLAFLEGDDYWNNELKLQTQIDFLEKNVDYSSCFAGISAINVLTGEIIEGWYARNYDVFNYVSLSGHWHIATCTFVMRNVFTDYYLEQMLRSNFVGDRILFTIAVKHGAIKYVDANLGVYRVNVPGAHSSRNSLVNSMDAVSALSVIYDLVDDDDKDAVLCEIEWYASRIKLWKNEDSDTKKCILCGHVMPTFLMDFNICIYRVIKKHKIVNSGSKEHLCPYCKSTALERHIYLYLDRLNFFDSIHNDTKILHIAPEQNLREIFMSFSNAYVSTPPRKTNNEYRLRR